VSYPFHVDEVLFGRHEEVEETLDELGLLHGFLEPRGREQVALQDLIDHLPIPLAVLLLLEDLAVLEL
jgi:hypothetical protein